MASLWRNSTDTHLTSSQGSNLGRALEIAQQTLADSQPGSRAIVLFTDGEAHNSNNLAVAQQLGQQGIPLLIIGSATLEGGPVADGAGRFLQHEDRLLISTLQRDTLMALAQASGGVYSDLQESDHDLQLLQQRLAQLSAKNLYEVDSRYTVQLFPWLVGASLLLFLLARGSNPAMAGWLLLWPLLHAPTPALAAPWDEQAAYNALIQGDHALAAQRYQGIDTYTGYLGRGVAAYRQQQWSQARDLFNQALQAADHAGERAKAAYNLGNALTQLND
ncbi:MAG: hypothetical protein FD130_2430, partial [Halothiobacillaceae bacterium]